MPEEIVVDENCEKCNAAVLASHRYCYNCGSYLRESSVTINIFNNSDLRQVFFFYFLYLFLCLVVKHSSWIRNYDQLFWVEVVLAIITVCFAWANRWSIKPLLAFNNFKWWRLIIVILIAALGSYLISFSVRELNINFFHAEISYYSAFSSYSYPIVIMIYSVALNPAVFEELAFRGIMYNYCANFLDERLVVFVTAFLFAIMHLTLISLVWLIPFGYLIGTLRRRYNTLWYGIIFHFTFNLAACVFELYYSGIFSF